MTVAAFPSQADLSGVVPVTRQVIAGDGLQGGGPLSADVTLDVGANPDGSIVVGLNDVGVGVLATDAQHGVRGGGTQHALVTPAVAGFMSALDKAKLNTIAPFAAPVGAAPPVSIDAGDAGAVGVSPFASHEDHEHPVNTALVANIAPVGVVASAGVSPTIPRGDHAHAHGAQALGTGTNHAVVTPNPGGIAGFMSPADKTKLDGLTPGGARQADYQFGRTVVIPAGGTLQHQGPGNTLAGVRVNRAGTITGGSIQVNVVDAVRAYKLSIRVNGIEVALVALPVGTIGASTAALAAAVVVGDVITAFMVRTAGAGVSSFSDQHAMVEVTQ